MCDCVFLKERDLPTWDSLPKWLPQAVLGQAQAGSQQLIWVSPVGAGVQAPQATLLCPPRPVRRSWIRTGEPGLHAAPWWDARVGSDSGSVRNVGLRWRRLLLGRCVFVPFASRILISLSVSSLTRWLFRIRAPNCTGADPPKSFLLSSFSP